MRRPERNGFGGVGRSTHPDGAHAAHEHLEREPAHASGGGPREAEEPASTARQDEPDEDLTKACGTLKTTQNPSNITQHNSSYVEYSKKVKKDGFPSFISQLFELQVFRRGLRLRPSVPRRERRMLALHLRHGGADGNAVGSPLHERLVRQASPVSTMVPSGFSSQGISRLSFVTSGASASALLRASSAASAL